MYWSRQPDAVEQFLEPGVFVAPKHVTLLTLARTRNVTVVIGKESTGHVVDCKTVEHFTVDYSLASAIPPAVIA